jgi:putative redox protein
MGHSLGGTAVLAAVDAIPEVKAVVTIGAPSTPSHVIAQFAAKRAEINATGSADVNLAGRTFTISRSFVDDLENQDLRSRIPNLRCALLVFHAPLDGVVSINEATAIFGSARHPKSFVSLDGADHLLTNAADARYVAETTAAWVRRYLSIEEEGSDKPPAPGQVQVSELNHKFLREVVTDHHRWLSDEPTAMGGSNLGPDPYEHLLAALGSCTSMTIRMYANHKKLNLTNVDVRLQHSRVHAQDCEDCESELTGKVDVLERWITLEGDLTEKQRARLLQIADRCPVHKTLEGDIHIRTNPA